MLFRSPVSYNSSSSAPAYTTVGGSITASTAASTMVSSATALTSGAFSSCQAYLSGSHMMPFIFNTTLDAGDYVLAQMISTSSSSTGTGANMSAYAGGTYISNHSLVYVSALAPAAYKQIGLSTTNSSTNYNPYLGVYSTTSTGFPSTITVSDIRQLGGGTNYWLYWNYALASINST